MRTTLLKLIKTSFLFMIVIGMLASPLMSVAQEGNETTENDTIEVVEDNSSSFNDSVQFDDMEPVFYEAASDDEASESEGGMGNIWLYAGIAIVLVIVLVVLKKAGKKKS